MRISWSTLFLFASGLGIVTSPAPSAADASKAHRELPTLGVSLELPQQAVLKPVRDAILIELTGGRRRYVPTISLAPGAASQGAPAEGLRRRQLTPEITIEFTLQQTEGGSGGPEASLEGTLQVEKKRFRVACHYQGDALAPPRGDECLVWLATLRRLSPRN